MSGRVCHDCGDAKALYQFSRNRGYSDGFMTRCKLCDAARRKARRDGTTYTPVSPKARWQRTPGEAKEAKEVQQQRAKRTARIVPRNARSLAEFVAASAPEVSVLDALPITPAAVGPLRTITEQEHIKILAGNIATIAGEVIDIAEVALQDGRSLPESGFTVDLQHVHHLMHRLVEWFARSAGLEAA